MTMLFIFDMDGTIIRNRAFRYAYEKIPEVLGLNVDKDRFAQVFLDSYYELVSINELKKAFDWDYVTNMALNKMNILSSENVFSMLFMDGIEKGLVEVIENADYVLREIKSKNNKVVLLTNGYRKYQIPALRKTKMIEVFDYLFTADDLENLKPHKEAFLKAISETGISDMDRIYFIGDHIYFDIYGALVSGLKNIFWLTTQFDSGTYKVKAIVNFMSRYIRERYRISINLDSLLERTIIIINKLEEILQKI